MNALPRVPLCTRVETENVCGIFWPGWLAGGISNEKWKCRGISLELLFELLTLGIFDGLRKGVEGS